MESFVRINQYDCEEWPWCVRRAFNAAVSASHLADHYFTYYSIRDPERVSKFSKLGEFVEYVVEATDGAFRDIRSISNAYKHLYTASKYSAHSSISSTGAIEALTITDPRSTIVAAEDEYEQEPADATYRSFVVFTRKDGSKLEFLPTLRRTVDFWDWELYEARA